MMLVAVFLVFCLLCLGGLLVLSLYAFSEEASEDAKTLDGDTLREKLKAAEERIRETSELADHFLKLSVKRAERIERLEHDVEVKNQYYDTLQDRWLDLADQLQEFRNGSLLFRLHYLLCPAVVCAAVTRRNTCTEEDHGGADESTQHDGRSSEGSEAKA